MQGNTAYHFELTAVSGRKLVISTVNSNVTVTYNGKEYKASSGKIEITLESSAKTFTVTSDAKDYISLSCEIISNG